MNLSVTFEWRWTAFVFGVVYIREDSTFAIVVGPLLIALSKEDAN